MGSEPLALEIATKCLSRRFLDTPARARDRQGHPGRARAQLRRARCSPAPATRWRRWICGRTPPKVTAPTLVMTGSEDCLTPIDAGPDGAGARWIADNIRRRVAVRDRGQRPHEPHGGARAVGQGRDRVLPVRRREAGGRRLMHVTLCDVGPRDGLQNDRVALEPAGARRAVRPAGRDRPAAHRVRELRQPEGRAADGRRRGGLRRTRRASTASSTRRSRSTRAASSAPSRPAPTRSTSPTRSRTRSARATRTRPWRTRRRPHEAMIAAAHAAGVRASVTLGASFGCPFEGPVTRGARDRARRAHGGRGRRRDHARRHDRRRRAAPGALARAGGAARRPAGSRSGCTCTTRATPATRTPTPGIEAGATLFDASIGGLGGCPFAPRATGNIATEDLVYLLDGLGVETGVDLDAADRASRSGSAGVLGRELPGQLYKAGPFVPTG